MAATGSRAPVARRVLASSGMRGRTLVLASLLLLPLAAPAEELNRVAIGDLPGTDGRWQEGAVVVRAPAGEVQRWLSDVRDWPARFPDVEWSRDVGTTADGRRIIRFRSRAIGRPMTIRIRERPGLIAYDGEGKDVTTQGKNWVEPLDGERTRVILQTTAEVHGALGTFVSARMKRDRARRKLAADLGAIVKLANGSAATRP